MVCGLPVSTPAPPVCLEGPPGDSGPPSPPTAGLRYRLGGAAVRRSVRCGARAQCAEASTHRISPPWWYLGVVAFPAQTELAGRWFAGLLLPPHHHYRHRTPFLCWLCRLAQGQDVGRRADAAGGSGLVRGGDSRHHDREGELLATVRPGCGQEPPEAVPVL